MAEERAGSRSTGRRKRSAGGRRHPDIEVARLLVKRGFVPKDVAMAALKEQRARAQEKQPRIPFIQLLVRNKTLPRDRITAIQDEVRKHTYICPSCEGRAVLVPSERSEGAACPRCGSRIALDSPSGGAMAPPAAEFASGRDMLLAPPGVDKLTQGALAFGRYEILGEIGRGAMGVVYRARHKTLGKEVALKVLLTGEDAREAQVARFRREAAAVQKLRHDGIVPVHDFGSEGDVYFLTMELVPGGLTLHKLWKDPERAPQLKTRLGHLVQVARAIDYAHRRGVIHRDLKPANVLLAPSGDALVADFGLAKDEGDDLGLTQSEDRLGTPLFMAPEQVRRGSSEVDGRVDVWALGIMLFLATTGRYPFRGRTIMDLYLKILNEEPDWTGERSQAPDRDFGMAPKPSEVRSMERRRASGQRPALSDQDTIPVSQAPVPASARARKISGNRPALDMPAIGPPPFIPPPDQKEVPRDLKLVIEMALAKDPWRRYETAGALARDLERFLAGEPVLARPPGRFGMAWRRAKAHWPLVLASLLLVLAPVVFYLERSLEAAAAETKAANAKLAEERRHAEEERLRAEEVRKAAEARAAREGRSRRVSESAEQIWGQASAQQKRTVKLWKDTARKIEEVCVANPEEPAPVLLHGLASAMALEQVQARADLSHALALLAKDGVLWPAAASRAIALASALGDLDAGIALAQLGLASDPADDACVAGMGRLLLQQGKLDAARDLLAPLASQDQKPRSQVVAAFVALARNEPTRALDLAKAAQRSLPEDPEALTIRGLAGIACGDPDAAGFLKKARESGDSGFAASAADGASILNAVARDARFAKDSPRAVVGDDLAAALAPWSPVPCFWGAETRFRDLHDVPGALASFDAALVRDPTFVEAAELRAELLLARRDEAGLERAEKSFRDELARFPTGRARLDLALVLLGRGRIEDAEKQLAGVGDPDLAARRALLRGEVERRRGNADLARSLAREGRSGRTGARAQRDLLAVARARLLAHDAEGASEVTAEILAIRAPHEARPRGISAYLLRLPPPDLVARALEAASLAARGRKKDVADELDRASRPFRGGAAPAEVAPAVLRATPELKDVLADPDFARFLEEKHGSSDEE